MSLADIQRGSGEAIASGASFQISFGNSLLYAFRGLNVFNNILLTTLIGMFCLIIHGTVLKPSIGFAAGRLWYLDNATAKLLGVDPCSDKRSTATISMLCVDLISIGLINTDTEKLVAWNQDLFILLPSSYVSSSKSEAHQHL